MKIGRKKTMNRRRRMVGFGAGSEVDRITVTAAYFTGAPSNSYYKIFCLVQRWPGTFCKYNKCVLGVGAHNKFIIHALWPQKTTPFWPATNCCGSRTGTGSLQLRCKFDKIAVRYLFRISGKGT